MMTSALRPPRVGTFAHTAVLSALILAAAGAWAATAPSTGLLSPLADLASRTLERVKAADAGGARATFKDFEDLWSPVEDGVRSADPGIYARIEVAATRTEAALEVQPPQLDRAAKALADLAQAAGDFGKVSPSTA
ncbi:MAG TPA: hypothetical protein VMQ10_06475, partial [Spirochaetia bacterium]|nr:hypothetical protein [Spirochaetia bacterium]